MNKLNDKRIKNKRDKLKPPGSVEKIRKAAAERKRKERERIRQDHEQYALMKEKERERSRKRRESKKIKSINDLSERGKRKQRSEWRKRYHKHADKLRKQKATDRFAGENTPPSSPANVQCHGGMRDREDLRKSRHKKKLRKSREKYKKQIKELQEKLEKQIRKTNKWKMRHHRVTHKKSKPKNTKPHAIVKKYNKRKAKTQLLGRKVREFLIDDENSYSTPGRKDTITKNKIKMQKLYLSESLIFLHKKFISTTNVKISYALFCRLKPFWVIHRPPNKRDTCMCKYHTNFWFLFQKCKQYSLVQHKNIRELIGSITCEMEDKKCMYRECGRCKFKNVTFNSNCTVSLNSKVHYYEWENVKEDRIKNGKKVQVNVTRKVKKMCTLNDLKERFLSKLNFFMQHMYRVYHQSSFSKKLRTSLCDDEVFIIIDFSENYQLKYAREIQSRHFGASNEQLVLHTGAYFLNKKIDGEKTVSVTTFCTISSTNRHDASAIWAHLQPILTKIKEEHNSIAKVHIMSDGPTKQYRNKSNLYLFCYFMESFGFQAASYNFSESGHGKSVADGVGGVIKRTADTAVLAGKDVSNIDEFLNCVKDLKVLVLKIEENSIKVTDAILSSVLSKIIAIPETMKIHQATWISEKKVTLNCRYLSCYLEDCRSMKNCSHEIETSEHSMLKTTIEEPEQSTSSQPNHDTYPNKTPQRIRYCEVYSESESEDSPDSPNEIAQDDFVLIRLATKKNFKHYVGQVCKVYGDGDADVKFCRKTGGGKFVFPPVEDIATVNCSDIVQILAPPQTHRGAFSFKNDLSGIINLN